MSWNRSSLGVDNIGRTIRVQQWQLRRCNRSSLGEVRGNQGMLNHEPKTIESRIKQSNHEPEQKPMSYIKTAATYHI